MVNSFTDTQKQDFWNKSWFTGQADINAFNKITNEKGQEEMYIKPSAYKQFNKEIPLWNPEYNPSAEEVKNRLTKNLLASAYKGFSSAVPNEQATYMKVWMDSGLLDSIDMVNNQIANLKRDMLGSNAEIFSDPNLDAKTKVELYKTKQQGFLNNVNQLQELWAFYTGNLTTLTKYQLEKQNAERQKNLEALNYLKFFDDQEKAKQQIELDRQKLAMQQNQFDTEMGYKYSEMNKPVLTEDPITGEKTWTTPPTAGSNNLNSVVSYSVNKRWTENLQCWQLVNDYIQKSTWANPTWDLRFEDTYQDKLKAIETIGKSLVPVVWWLFVLNTGTSTGHTWIIKKINDDWSIEVLEANAAWLRKGQPPVTNKYTTTKWMTFSVPPQNSNKTTGTTGKIPQDISRYITNSSFTDAEKKNINRDVINNGLTLDQVKELYPVKNTESKPEDFSTLISKFDMSQINSFDELDQLAEEINQKYPELNLDDEVDAKWKVTKKWITSILETKLTKEQFDKFSKQDKEKNKWTWTNNPLSWVWDKLWWEALKKLSWQ